MSDGKKVVPFPKSRRVIVDIGKVTARRPTMYGLLEADLSGVQPVLRSQDLSMTAYLAATLGRAIAAHPQVHALRDWRGRLVMFDNVDIAVSIEINLEGKSFPLTHVVRAAESTSVAAITEQIRAVQQQPTESPSLQHEGQARLFIALPGPVRRLLLRSLYRIPTWHRRIMGTAGVSSVGMVGEGGGWAIGLPVHPVNVLVGGMGGEGRAQLALTLGFDHDVVDGAPATRFASEFRRMLEQGDALGD